MNAGRELDAMIAEKVMGFAWVDSWQERPGRYLVSPDGWLAGWEREDGGVTAHLDGVARDVVLRPYSTDIAAAWQVVEKVAPVAADGFDLRRDGGDWIAYFRLGDEDFSYCGSQGVTAPLAICHAALKAVGVEVPA